MWKFQKSNQKCVYPPWFWKRSCFKTTFNGVGVIYVVYTVWSGLEYLCSELVQHLLFAPDWCQNVLNCSFNFLLQLIRPTGQYRDRGGVVVIERDR